MQHALQANVAVDPMRVGQPVQAERAIGLGEQRVAQRKGHALHGIGSEHGKQTGDDQIQQAIGRRREPVDEAHLRHDKPDQVDRHHAADERQLVRQRGESALQRCRGDQSGDAKAHADGQRAMAHRTAARFINPSLRWDKRGQGHRRDPHRASWTTGSIERRCRKTPNSSALNCRIWFRAEGAAVMFRCGSVLFQNVAGIRNDMPRRNKMHVKRV